MRRSLLPQRRDIPGWHLAAYVDVLEERVLLSSFPLGIESLVNATITGNQKFSAQTDRSITTTPDGGALVAWTSTTQVSSASTASVTSSASSQTSSSGQVIVARFVDPLGNPVGGEIQVSSGPCQSAGNAVVGVAGPGRYVIAWEATGESLDQSGAGEASQETAAGKAVGAGLVGCCKSSAGSSPAVAIAWAEINIACIARAMGIEWAIRKATFSEFRLTPALSKR